MSNPNFPLPLGPLAAGPLIGEQGENDAFIWAQAKDSTPLTLTVFLPNLPLRSSWTVTPRSDEFFCVVFHATGLTLPGTYEYELSSKLGTTQRFKLRRPPREDSKRLRIVYGSCIQHANKVDSILKSIADEGADLMMFVGDNTYFQANDDANDWDTEALMMAAHLRWRGASGMRELCGNVSTLAIWDDHDYGSNDIGGNNPQKGEALRCFKRMWAQRHYGMPGARGIFSSVRCGPAQIFLLDVRFHREPEKVISQEQMQWLKDSLRASDAPVKLIVSGSQILPTAARERGWECWEKDGSSQRDELLIFLANHAINGVVFITGDVHLGQLLFTRGVERADRRRGGDIWELTSSPLTEPMEGNPVMHGATPAFDRYMIHEVLEPNYGVIDINLERERKEILLELKSVDRSLFRIEVDFERLHIRPARPPKVRAFATGAGHSQAFFFRGDKFVKYDIAARKAISDPQPIKSHWPEFQGEFDTGTEWPTGRTYFFKGNGYRLWGASPGRVSQWTYISDFFHWPLEFQTGIDAVLLWSDGYAYAFKGRNYIRFNINTRVTVGNYPQPIAKWWKGVWAEGIDAVFPAPNGKLYFFRGDEYIRYDIQDDSADGPPELIANHWPGLSF